MKKTLFFGLMATALGLAACSDEKEAIFNENTQKGMILNATVVQGIDTRATIDNSEEVWPFNFTSGDKVLVSNPELEAQGGSLYEFTSDATHFSCTVAQPTSSAVTWTARYPKGAVDLTNQTGKLEDVAKNYALVGSTSAPTTGASGLNIDMEAKVAILKIINGGGHLELNMKKGPSEWVTGLSEDDLSVETSTTEAKLFETDEAGEHYVVVPAGIQLSIKDGSSISLKSTTVSGFTAGKYYTMTINGAKWDTYLTYATDESVVETIEFQVGVIKPSSGYYNLNSTGDLWAVTSSDGKTLYVQSNRKLIKAFLGGYMFAGFVNVKEIKNLNLIDWTGITSLTFMFRNCSSLEEVDLTDVCTENVTNFDYMFSGCSALKKVKNLSKLNTKSATNMSCMFAGCSSLTDLDVSTFNTAKVTDMSGMFIHVPNINGMENLNTASVTDMSQMFSYCTATELDLSNFDTGNVTNMWLMFGNCENLTNIKGLETLNTENVTRMDEMFSNCKAYTDLDLSTFNTANVTTMKQMFAYCDNLESVNLSNLDAKKVTDMSCMFYYCKSLANIDLSNIQTQNLANMESMFSRNDALTEIDLSSINTSNVTNFYSVLSYCPALETVDFSSINTQSATNLRQMFYEDEKLSSLTLSADFNFTSDPTYSVMLFAHIGTTDNKTKVYGCNDTVKTQVVTSPYNGYVGWNPAYIEFGD